MSRSTFAKHMLKAVWPILLCVLGLSGGCRREEIAPGIGEPERLTLGAFSVMREVLHDGLIPEFIRQRTETGKKPVHFEESYLASGALSRAIQGGFDADVALFSLDPDVEPLVKAGLVASNWNAGPTNGHVVRTLVVIGHRPDNPKRIGDWVDLTNPGVSVVYADPKTSGGARWNLMAVAADGYWPNGVLASATPMNPAGAEKLLADIQRNVSVMDPSGRQSLATFLRDSGDAIVTYENDLVQCERLTGRPMPYVIPNRTVWIEIPAVEVIATTQVNGRSELAREFLAFLGSESAKPIWARFGFRPVSGTGDAEGLPPVPQGVVRIADMGGWKLARENIFGPDGLWSKSFLERAAKPAENAPAENEK
ncbi:sulfate ABC transporter substrate-binding protein [bacterium]|nr:sulfate ABC transporter substrate-binding protein [bacterium]